MGRNAQALSGQIQKGAQPFKKGGAVSFEKSRKDVEPKVMKEGSKKEEKFDANQFKKGGKK